MFGVVEASKSLNESLAAIDKSHSMVGRSHLKLNLANVLQGVGACLAL